MKLAVQAWQILAVCLLYISNAYSNECRLVRDLIMIIMVLVEMLALAELVILQKFSAILLQPPLAILSIVNPLNLFLISFVIE